MVHASITTHPAWLQRLDTPKGIAGARHLNPALEEHGGKRWICWRVEVEDGSSRLAWGELGLSYTQPHRIGKARWLDTGDGEVWPEDPRLCSAGGKLWLLYSKVRNAGGTGWNVVQCVREITDPRTGTLGPEIVPMFGKNTRAVEKNWTPFEFNNRLHLHYGPDRGGVWDVEAGREIVPAGCQPYKYPWGTLSGRTQARRMPDGRFLAIGGGFEPHVSRDKRYFLSAWTFDPAKRFALAEVSKLPMAFASDEDASLPCPRCAAYDPCCLFACGMVTDQDGRLLVACGVHDSWLCLLSFDPARLGLVPAHQARDRRAAVPRDTVPPAGQVLVEVVLQSVAEPGGPYHNGECFLTTAERAAALGPLVEKIR
jgi:hypothetical protein